MHSGIRMLVKECRYGPLRDGRRHYGRIAYRGLLNERRCRITRTEVHSQRCVVALCAAASSGFLTPQLLTAAISKSKSIDDLFSICSNNWNVLNHIHVSAALSAAVKLPGAQRAAASPLLDSLADLFLHTLPGSTLREVANVVWSLAKLGRPVPHALLSAVLLVQQRHDLLGTASPQALANILWALATWQTRGPGQLLLLLLEHCCTLLPMFRPQDTANVLWALGRLNQSTGPLPPMPASLLPGLLSTAAEQATGMTPQGLATSVWACHRLRLSHAAFLHAAATAFRAQLPAASPTDVALLTASLAGLRFRCPVLLRAVAERCCREARGSNGSSMGADSGGVAADAVTWNPFCRKRVLWAFATLKYRHPVAVRALLASASEEEDTDGIGGASAALDWIWEPGGWTRDRGEYNDIEGGGGSSNESDIGYSRGGAVDSRLRKVALGASTLIWCLARLGCGRSAGYEQRVAIAAAESLWAARDAVGLSHAAIAAWGLEQLGLPQDRMLDMARTRLLQALERISTPNMNTVAQASNPSAERNGISHIGDTVKYIRDDIGRDGGASATVTTADCLLLTAMAEDPSASRAGITRRELPPGDLDAAVMVLWCMARQGSRPATAVRSPVESRSDNAKHNAAEDADGMVTAAAARSHLLDAFSRVAPRLLHRLSIRQLPLVCCAYVQMGRNDAEVLGAAAELLMGRVPASGPRTGGTRWSPQPERRIDEEAQPWRDCGSGPDSILKEDEEGEDEAGEEGGVPTGEGNTLLQHEDVEELSEEVVEQEDWEYDMYCHLDDNASDIGVETSSSRGKGGNKSSRRSSSGTAGRCSRGGPVLLSRFPRNGLAMVLWALASAGYASPQLMQQAAAEVMHLFPRLPAAAGPACAEATPVPTNPATNAALPPQPVGAAVSRWAALILWAFAASDCYNPGLYDNLLSYVIRKVPRLGPGRAAVVLWACAVAGHYRRDVLEALCRALQEDLRTLPPATFTQANWAIAHLSAGLCLNWRGPAASHLTSLAPNLSRHQSAVILWTLAVQQLVLTPQDPRKFTKAVDLLLTKLTAPQSPETRLTRDSDWAGEWTSAHDTSLTYGGGGTAVETESQGADQTQTQIMVKEQGWDLSHGTHGDLDPDLHRLRNQSTELSLLEPGVALITAEALALLLASPHAAVRARVNVRLTALASESPPLPLPRQPPSTLPLPSSTAAVDGPDRPAMTTAPPSIWIGGEEAEAGSGARPDHDFSAARAGPSGLVMTRGSVMAQLAATWQHALRRRHPQQAAVAEAARQLGYFPRLLRTHGSFPLALPSAVELPHTAPAPTVLLLADRSDFATNIVGQPLGLLFTTVQMLRERGWLVAVVVAPQFEALRPASRQVRQLRHLLQAAGVRQRAAGEPSWRSCDGGADNHCSDGDSSERR
ncbi:hypothetical protein VaNZ11_004025 [Volvox africanus]|uniref:RAP domain-containing protein n=1 Tax=Volvox africanus TaxID=51714 RepID=A0ABQ5RVE6_9CHLO|nr:hypothetical protein VaNZ11_004025 [Volvox africanus]